MHGNSTPRHPFAKPLLPGGGRESGYANMPVTKVPGWYGTIAWDALLNGMATGLFLERIKGIRAPSDRKLVARLVTDPRLDKLDCQSLRALIKVASGWTKQPIVADRDLRPIWEKGTWGPETPTDFKALGVWRERLRASVSEWNGR